MKDAADIGGDTKSKASILSRGPKKEESRKNPSVSRRSAYRGCGCQWSEW